MGAIRQFDFVSGPETATLPSAGTPTLADDLITLGFADGRYAALSSWFDSQQTIAAVKAISVADRSNNQTLYLDDLSAYFAFDSASGAANDDVDVLEPDTGTGRWIRRADVTVPGGAGNDKIIPMQIVFPGESPPAIVDDIEDQVIFEFPPGIDTDIRFSIPMDEYTPGDQIKLSIRAFCSSTGNVVFETIASLYQPGDDATAAPANQRTDPRTVAMPATPNDRFTSEVNELSSATGQINAVPIAAEDDLTINLKRKGSDGSDTATGGVFVVVLVSKLNA